MYIHPKLTLPVLEGSRLNGLKYIKVLHPLNYLLLQMFVNLTVVCKLTRNHGRLNEHLNSTRDPYQSLVFF